MSDRLETRADFDGEQVAVVAKESYILRNFIGEYIRVEIRGVDDQDCADAFEKNRGKWFRVLGVDEIVLDTRSLNRHYHDLDKSPFSML